MVSFVVAGFVSGTMGFSCFENLACQTEFQFVCALCVRVCVWLGSACCCYKNNSNAAQHIETTSGPVAQWIRHRPTEPGIAGSSPAGVMSVRDVQRSPLHRQRHNTYQSAIA